ncbi:hypothetical protein COV24_04325 [candidate division WWE3 bacterium CG10_big_fil_rev_8_21_14_0_10_32_10]|uniref:LTD domain-containing protein n=1 Tax=candidate division WWE3 bacterium CG10_big_fil_rev_8_21_14_0_10_32_10 TaxID=1975090 RepID=A0A2H0R9H9_UNCKA|nr:MAG: hypothetical protein COV24_04325 [candidate division WWE3 bacterium CG10_big_fil_rev_8_21_14_0_10_32_10]
MKYLYIISILIVIFFSFPNCIYASNGDFVFTEVSSLDLNKEFTISIKNITDEAKEYNFKIDIGIDGKEYKSGGEIYNEETKMWSGYNSQWSGTPFIPISSGENYILKGRIVTDFVGDVFYLRLRYRNTNGNTYESVLLDPINVETGYSIPEVTLTPTPTSTLSTSPTPTGSVTKDGEESTEEEYVEPLENNLTKDEKQKINISEFMPNPKKDENEWVELYNGNDTNIELTNWYVDDITGSGGTPFVFSIKIQAKSYASIDISKLLLNNSGDSVSLLDDDKNPIHIVKYKKTTQGSSIQKLSNEKWYITKDITKNKENIEYKEIKIDVPNITTENSADSVLKTSLKIEENTETESKKNTGDKEGTILGAATALKIEYDPTNYGTLVIRKEDVPYTLDSDNHVYVITSNNQPTAWDMLYSFVKKAFW